MPGRHGLRPLKAWRYVGVFGPELMLCAGTVRVGRARQAFWAVWDRAAGRLREHTQLGRGAVELGYGSLRVRDTNVQVDLVLVEEAGIETVTRSDSGYAWTRKQGGIPVAGTVMLEGEPRRLAARAVIDDTAAYYDRHTFWRWSAGVGRATDGSDLAWNLVAGINDPATGSERTVWVDGVAQEAPPSRFAADLTGVDDLQFRAEAARERSENRLLIRSRYRQPFGTFSGRLATGHELAEGYGVMEDHDVYW